MSNITIKEYFAVEGSRFSNKDAQIVGPVLTSLAEQGGVTARDVLDSARSENSPLHPYFEWNDHKAADLFRLNQAREMMRSVKITYADQSGVHQARAFHIENAPDKIYSREPRQYRAFQILHGESAFAAQMMKSAFEDLQGWRRKYEPYAPIWENFSRTFATVINQIGECESEIVHPNLPAFTDDAIAELIDWRMRFIDAKITWDSWVEQMRYVIEAIKEAETVFCAADEIKHRDCIRCGKSFLSYSGGNRMCRSCSELKTVRETSEPVARIG